MKICGKTPFPFMTNYRDNDENEFLLNSPTNCSTICILQKSRAANMQKNLTI
jgi:hypothetical protein